jgi:hypothetical protein
MNPSIPIALQVLAGDLPPMRQANADAVRPPTLEEIFHVPGIRVHDPVLEAEERKASEPMQKRQGRLMYRAALRNLGGRWQCQCKLTKCANLISANKDFCRSCVEVLKAMTSPEILQEQFEEWKSALSSLQAPDRYDLRSAELFLDFLIAQSRKAAEISAEVN